MPFFDDIDNREDHIVYSILQSTVVIVLRTLLLSLIVITIIISNIIGILVVRRLRELQIVSKVLFVNLNVAGLLCGVIVCFPGILSSLTNAWILGDIYCRISSVISGTCCSVTIWTLAAISVDRYLAIRNPVQYRSTAKLRYILMTISLFWLAGILTFLLPFFFKEKYVGYHPNVYICSMYWRSSVFCVITGLYIPLLSATVITWSSCKITKNLKRLRSHRLSLHAEQKFSSRCRRTAKIIRIIHLHALTYFIAWGPYTIAIYLVSFGVISKIPSHMEFVTTWLANCNFFMNVLILSENSKEFRERLQISMSFLRKSSVSMSHVQS